MDDVKQLGGNIELSGFSVLNGGEMIIVKKIVGNYVRKMEEHCKQFNGLKLRLKSLHQVGDKIKKFEIHGQLFDEGHAHPAEVVEHNVFVGVDEVCKKLVNSVSKEV